MQFTCRISILSKEITNIYNEANIISSDIKLHCTNSEFKIKSSNEFVTHKILYKQNASIINNYIQIVCTKNVNKRIALKYLNLMANLHELNKYLVITVGPNTPVCITCTLPHAGYIKLHIAPQE